MRRRSSIASGFDHYAAPRGAPRILRISCQFGASAADIKLRQDALKSAFQASIQLLQASGWEMDPIPCRVRLRSLGMGEYVCSSPWPPRIVRLYLHAQAADSGALPAAPSSTSRLLSLALNPFLRCAADTCASGQKLLSISSKTEVQISINRVLRDHRVVHEVRGCASYRGDAAGRTTSRDRPAFLNRGPRKRAFGYLDLAFSAAAGAYTWHGNDGTQLGLRSLEDPGTREVGPQHNQKIIGWLEKLNAWWREDETPWCGVFVGHVMHDACFKIPTHYYRAKAWADWGQRLASPAVGAIVVFDRTGGGHVGFVVGKAHAAPLLVLGGNQGNAVTIAPFALDCNPLNVWPPGKPFPAPGQLPVYGNSAASSTNEACPPGYYPGMSHEKARSARIEKLLRAVDEIECRRGRREYPLPFETVIRELEVMHEFAANFPQIPLTGRPEK